MANKRMFTMYIVDSDAFLDMPLSTQCLYFHLNMRADDDGFIGNPKRIQKVVGASEDDLKLLIAKRFLLVFEDGVIVIKHWKMHNTIRSDRYTPTQYQEELSALRIKDNKSYSITNGNQLATSGIPIASTDIGLDIGLDLDIKENITDEKPSSRISKHKYGKYGHVRLKDEEYNRLQDELGQDVFGKCIQKLDEYIQETGKKYKDHNLTIRRWVIDAVKENKVQGKPKLNPNVHNFQEREYSKQDMQTLEQRLLQKNQ